MGRGGWGPEVKKPGCPTTRLVPRDGFENGRRIKGLEKGKDITRVWPQVEKETEEDGKDQGTDGEVELKPRGKVRPMGSTGPVERPKARRGKKREVERTIPTALRNKEERREMPEWLQR